MADGTHTLPIGPEHVRYARRDDIAASLAFDKDWSAAEAIALLEKIRANRRDKFDRETEEIWLADVETQLTVH